MNQIALSRLDTLDTHDSSRDLPTKLNCVVFHPLSYLPKSVTEGNSVRASIATARPRIHIDLRPHFRATRSHTTSASRRVGPVITIAITIGIAIAIAIAVADANTIAATKHQD